MPTKSELRKFRDENGCKNIEEARMLWKLKLAKQKRVEEPAWVQQARECAVGAHMLTVPDGFVIGALYMDTLKGVPKDPLNPHMVRASDVANAKTDAQTAMREINARTAIMLCDNTSLPDLIVYEPKDRERISEIWQIEEVPAAITDAFIWQGKIHPIYRGIQGIVKQLKRGNLKSVGL